MRKHQDYKYWPKSKGQQGSEEAFQIAVATFLDYHLPEFSWYHPPNGGKRNLVTATSLKKQGTKRGVPDIIIVSHKTVVELKAREGKPEQEQLQWLESYRKIGWHAYWCNSMDEFLSIMRHVGVLKNNKP
jgi:hypothetical protein